MLIIKAISLDDIGKGTDQEDSSEFYKLVKIRVSFYFASARCFQNLQSVDAVSSVSPVLLMRRISSGSLMLYSILLVSGCGRHSVVFLLEIGLTTYLPDFRKASFPRVITYL